MQVRVFVGLVNVSKWCLSCVGLMCAADAQSEVNAAKVAVEAADARAEVAMQRADVAARRADVAARRVDVAVRRADAAVRRADVAVNNGRVTSAKLSKVSTTAYALCLLKLTHCAVLLLRVL
jgi:hypothetical protein